MILASLNEEIAFQSYLSKANIEFLALGDSAFKLANLTANFILIAPDQGKLFDASFNFIAKENLRYRLAEDDYVVFKFAYKYYFSQVDKVSLIEVKWLGTSQNLVNLKLPHLGVHTGFELLTAVGLSSQYCSKANFLNVTSLGICDKHTLAGVYNFQETCLAYGINPVLGATLATSQGPCKAYVSSDHGWRQLSSLISRLSCDKLTQVPVSWLLTYELDILVLEPGFNQDMLEDLSEIYQDKLYLGVNFLEYKTEAQDNLHLLWLQKALTSSVKKVWIHDSYYLNADDVESKKMLNLIGNISTTPSVDQWFKSDTELFTQMSKLFKDQVKCYELAKELTSTTQELASRCYNFRLNKTRKLPEYSLTALEAQTSSDKLDLFWNLIEQGIADRQIKDVSLYLARVTKEFNVIYNAGVLDYFLILYDFCRECRDQDILIGFGRGSAAGSLISYLLKIVEIDPIKYDLLFERFLNEGRALKSLPDIDTDIEDCKRDLAKSYLIKRYTKARVANVGTYQLYKLKSGLTDVLKYLGVDFKTVKFATSMIGNDFVNGNFEDLMRCSVLEPKLLYILQQYPEIQPILSNILGQPRSMGVHASATVIVPETELEKTFAEFAPVTEVNGFLLTQWQGKELEDLGFLKADFLGLSQLTKFSQILKLIASSEKKVPDLYNLNLKDSQVFKYFHLGWNEDVFQFGSPSQKKYSTYLKPDNIEELSAANALYRPGPMDSGAHNHYVELKFKQREVSYDSKLDDVTSTTGGLYVYQEQVMAAYSKVTKATLVEADDFRKFVTKLKGKYKQDPKYVYHEEKFINGYLALGVTEAEAYQVWEKIINFSKYAFNRSHACSYAVMGYISQYLKVHYPLEFWTVSLKNSEVDRIPAKLNEIMTSGLIKSNPPSINISTTEFTNNNQDKIFWSLSSVYGCGQVSVSKLIHDRDVNGSFYSVAELVKRSTKTINKTVLYNLAFCGALDEIANVQRPKDRLRVIQELDTLRKEKVMTLSVIKEPDLLSDWWWELKVKRLCGFDGINYKMLHKYLLPELQKLKFMTSTMLDDFEGKRGNVMATSGVVVSVISRKTKTNKLITHLVLDQSSLLFNLILWEEPTKEYEEMLNQTLVGKLIALSGTCSFDTFRQQNSMYSCDQTVLQVLN